MIPRNRRWALRRCDVNAVPTKPPAPVTTINALSRVGDVTKLEPFPAVFAIKTYAALHERLDMPPAFARRVTAIMNDAHRRHVCRCRHARKPHAPIVILEVEEE